MYFIEKHGDCCVTYKKKTEHLNPKTLETKNGRMIMQ